MSIEIDADLLKELVDLGDRLSEDRLYEVAVNEVQLNKYDIVAKAKALEEAEGDERKARAFYTKHRVRRIRDLLAEQAIKNEAERIEEEKQRRNAELEQLEADNKLKIHRKILEEEKIRQENDTFLVKLVYLFFGLVVIYALFQVFK